MWPACPVLPRGFCLLRHGRLAGPSWPGLFVSGSHIERLFLQTLVEIGDVFPVAIEEFGGDLVARAEAALGALAPARVRNIGVHVRPEAVLAALNFLPEAHGPLLDERKAHDRLH